MVTGVICVFQPHCTEVGMELQRQMNHALEGLADIQADVVSVGITEGGGGFLATITYDIPSDGR